MKSPVDQQVLESAIVALIAEFVGAITGLRPPIERRLFPPEHEAALSRLIDGLITVIHECQAGRGDEV